MGFFFFGVSSPLCHILPSKLNVSTVKPSVSFGALKYDFCIGQRFPGRRSKDKYFDNGVFSDKKKLLLQLSLLGPVFW